MNVVCPQQRDGGGCQIYAHRPYACRFYSCSWVMGEGGDELRPDRIHAVWNVDRRRLIIHEDAAHPGIGRRWLADRAVGVAVVLYIGDRLVNG